MTLTSVFCLPERKGRDRHHGFTLLELLVVLSVMALLTSMVAPRLASLSSSVEGATQRSGVLAGINGLGYRAFALSQSFELSATGSRELLRDGSPVLALPAGWQLEAKAPVQYSFSGFCAGGELELREPDGTPHRLVLTAPRCLVARWP